MRQMLPADHVISIFVFTVSETMPSCGEVATIVCATLHYVGLFIVD